MSIVGQRERATQDRVVQLFNSQLAYDYLGNWIDRADNSNIEENHLRAFLREQGYDDALIGKALFELSKVAGDQSKSLYDVNKVVYSLLRYGVKVKPDMGEAMETVWLIDWKNPLNNHFAIAEEVTVTAAGAKRPDIVLYVNGIALGVLELKRSTVSVSEGVRQNLASQQERYIRPFFATVQLVMAGNDTQGLRYGVIETPEKYVLTWKEETYAEVANLLDRHLLQVCEKARFLELLHDFIVFDAGTKKVCRPNQYFGVKAAQARVRQREGGIIWHTQGSGKSLTMVWLAKWIRENVTDPRVLIITDRTELDDQIENVFVGVSEEIYRTKSGADLIRWLNQARPWLICSLIHKFANREEGDVQAYIAELRRNLPSGFKVKGDLYVFVDECHRTQSGELHEAMKAILPNAMFIGFTGTPLLKSDKKISIEVFGSYIHTYKYDEAVKDGVVLDLRYEARDIDQHITSPAKIDLWFETKTRGLNDVARAQLKQRWGTLQQVLSSRSRLEQIVADIILDMETRPRLASWRGNALLVSGSIYQACKLYQLFLDNGFDKCAIVTSYKPAVADIKGEETGQGHTERVEQYEIYNRMLGGQSVEEFETAVKEKFIYESGQMRLLIVVDKLLTGFDAPSATYLYIDRQMRDHGLFQAICRVNRLDDDDKEYGYIVDYKDLFNSLQHSVHDYTLGAFEGYDKGGVSGLLSDRLDKARDRLEDTREAIKQLCEPVPLPRDTQAYQHYFCARDAGDVEQLQDNEPKRLTLYKLTAALMRAYANLANEMAQAGYTQDEAQRIAQEVEHFSRVRDEVKLSSGDAIDLKAYEPDMRYLIDTYIRADESKKLSSFDDVTLIQLIVEQGAAAVDALPGGLASNKVAAADAIENNLRRLIIDEQPINPKYYDKMSHLLDTLIQERRQQAVDYAAYLARLADLAKKVTQPETASYPTAIYRSRALRALYDNLGQNEQLASALDEAIRSTKKDNWRGNRFKEREVQYVICQHIQDEALAQRIFELVRNQDEY